MTNKIVKVAVRKGESTYSLPVGASHDEVIRAHGIAEGTNSRRGFIDMKGNFLGREAAAKVAKTAGQAPKVAKLHSHHLKAEK